MTIYVDHTHLGRRQVTGIERVTAELFSRRSLAPVELTPVTAQGMVDMVMTQTVGLPLLLNDANSVLICPGFPPSPLLLPFARRVIPYIHDLFLITRPGDLNVRAKLYMSKPFRLAVRRYPRFLVNSHDTARKLAAFCRSDAEVIIYRPKVRNVFGSEMTGHDRRHEAKSTLRLLAIGTIEPRKNYLYAARILEVLRSTGFPDATLEIVGRNGWGHEWRQLASEPGVVLCGYQTVEDIRRRLQQADALLCTSHEEGLGLPLLEAQYAGIPVIAPDDGVFHEVLGDSGVYIDRSDARSAALTIASMIEQKGRLARFRELNARNLARWNDLAESDRQQVAGMITALPQLQTHRPKSRSRHRTVASRGNSH